MTDTTLRSDAPRALIVDDIASNRGLCALALEFHGYEYLEAEDGCAALEMMRQQRFDLVILDMAMPCKDGMSVIRDLAAAPELLPACLIVMTANPHMYSATEGLAVVDYVMCKPIDIEAFGKLITRLKPAAQAS
jgi:two-component system chemotaxis response regulator CheY